MANVKPFEIVAGPAKAWIAATGTAFPALTAAESAFGTQWIALGQTDGGVKVKHSQTVNEILTDQVTAPVKAVREQEGLEISMNLAELSLANYAVALNQGISGANVAAGERNTELYRGGSQVETVALLVRGPSLSPYGDFNLQYEVPAVYEAGEPEIEFTKADKAVLAVTFMAIADPDRTADKNSFGFLRAGR